MSALMDTGFLLALLDVGDKLHDACQMALAQEPNPVMPSVVIPELAYMALRSGEYAPFIDFMRSIANGETPMVFVERSDFARTADLMEKYADSKIDFVDCAIAAVAERLNISRILTVDQRDFRILRPKHVPAFEILPYNKVANLSYFNYWEFPGGP